MEDMEGWDENQADQEAVVSAFREKACAMLMAYLYLDNCNKSKYSTLIKGVASQYALKNNQYPKLVISAYQVLAAHPHDKSRTQAQSRQGQNKYSKAQGEDNNENEQIEAPDLMFAQLEGKCYCCGKHSHQSTVCRDKDKKPIDQWAINKAKNQAKTKAIQIL